MGKKAKVKMRRRIVIKGTVEEFALLGDFLRSFDKSFVEFSSGNTQQVRRGDLEIEILQAVDTRKEQTLPGWFQIGSRRAAMVLQGATQDQLTRFAEALRKEWFPTEAEKAQKESERRRNILDKVLWHVGVEILRARISANQPNVDAAPLKTD
ncbi:hypothetical protein HY622_04160 [Candidatus Uhrbacteria bacterium]|nr:hypothetical protein [Candidatus Uhrbacteria bacterium]